MKVAVLIFSVVVIGAIAEDFPKWDHLSAKFPKFNDLPMIEREAISKGWTLIADNCADKSGLFVGKRYMLKDEHATILIYDKNGQIAGIQMAYKVELKNGKYKKYGGAIQRISGKDGDYYYLTAYFTDPKKICSSHERPEGVIGDKLMFLSGVNKYTDAPLLEKDIGTTKWILGKCFPGMGIHYWYDISKYMNCDDGFPAFILYNRQGQLIGFGFLADVQVPGDRVEHPPNFMIKHFFKPATMPICLPKLTSRSTQHIYFNKAGMLITCT